MSHPAFFGTGLRQNDTQHLVVTCIAFYLILCLGFCCAKIFGIVYAYPPMGAMLSTEIYNITIFQGGGTMIFKYKPSSFFKGISNDRLKAIFDKYGFELDVDWKNRDPKSDTTVADKWEVLTVPKEKKKDFDELQEAFQRICLIANSRTNSLDEIKLFANYGEIKPLPDDFDDDAKWTKTERGAYVYLKNGIEKLRDITEVIYADDISYFDHMDDYQVECVDVNLTPNFKDSLKDAISDFFKVPAEERAQVRLESYPVLGTDKNYYFYTKDGDIEHMELRLMNEKECELKQIRRPYCVIFTFDSNHTIAPNKQNNPTDDEEDDGEGSGINAPKDEEVSGTPGIKLSLYALDIKASTRLKLARVIFDVLCGKPLDVSRVKKTEYLLGRIASRKYEFPGMRDVGIVKCYAKRIGILPTGNPADEMIINNTMKHNAYDSMERCFRWCRQSMNEDDSDVNLLFEQPYKVSLITIAMLTTDGKIITFDLRRFSCNRHNYPEKICDKIQLLIDRMHIVKQ